MEDVRLGAELERLFDLEELHDLGRWVLGVEPETIGGDGARGSFAAALARRCIAEDATAALGDAVVSLRERVDLASFRPRAAALEPGASIGGLVVEVGLGRGELGAVYRARRGDALFRLKRFDREATRDRSATQRFIALNRRIAARGRAGFESFEADGTLCVAEPWFDGETLGLRMQRTGPVRLRESWAILRGTLEALGALHERRLVHGELSLSNVLATEDGVVLLDAGSDLLVPRRGARAPEQLSGGPRTPRADVYAFGALLYELMSGRPVFDFSEGKWLAPLLGEPDPLSFHAPRGWVTGELDEFVLRLLDRDPARRPADANVALEILEALVELSVRRDSLLPDAELDARAQALLEDPADEVKAATLEAAVDQGADPRRIGDAMQLAAEEVESRAAKKRLLYRAAALYERSAADLDAAERAYQALLALEPDDEVASAHLERIYRRQGKHERLIETLLARAEHAPAARERAAAFARMGALLDVELDDHEQALVAYTHALCADPTEPGNAEQIERLAGADAQAWTEVLASCSAEIAAQGSPDAHSRLLAHMGRWYASRLKRPDVAVECYQAMLLADPGDDLALREIGALYREAGLWRELAGVLVLRADARVTPALGRDLRAEAAEIRATRLGDADGARQLYEHVLGEDPSHPKASAGLAELWRRAGDPAACIAVLERRAGMVQGRERQELLRQIADVEERDRVDLEAAARCHEQILADDPDDLEALRSLDRAYAKLGRYPELIANLERQLGLALLPQQKVELLERMAAIRADELHDRGQAAELLERALELDATREGALEELAGHYRALERWPDLARTLERQLERPLAPSARAVLLARLAEVLGERLGQPEAALRRWEGVLELDADNVAALGAVARLRATLGDQESALSALETLAAKATSPADKARHLASAARLLGERGDHAGAVERLKRALDATPGDDALRERLVAAYLAQGDARAAATVLERRIEQVDTDFTRAKLCAELATLLRERLGDGERAKAAALRAVGCDPTNATALVLLGDMAYEASELAEAADLYEKVAPRGDAALLARYADVLSRLGNTDEALAVAERLLALAPSEAAALGRAARLASASGAWARAGKLAASWLERLDARDFADRGEALLILGSARFEQGDGDGALEALEQAARILPDDPRPLSAVARIYEARGAFAELERTLERNLDRVAPEARVELWLRLGEIAEQHLRDPGAAARRYLAALAERPKDRRVLSKLLALYSAGKDWAKLVDVILELAEIVDDPLQQAKYLQTASRVAAHEIGDKARAAALLDRALALDPLLADGAAEAVAWHLDLGDTDAAVRALEQRLRAVSVAGDRVQALSILDQLAELHLSQLRVEDAITATEAAVQLAPESVRRSKLLAELYASEPMRYAAQAIQAQEAILREDPYRPEPHETLYTLYTEAQRPDGAWCACQALVALHRASSQQEAFFRLHRRHGPLATSAHVTDDEWSALLVHPEAEPEVTRVFALIQPCIVAARTTPLGDVQRVDPAGAQGLALALANAAGVLGLPLPALVHDPAQPGAIALLRSTPGAILLGKNALAPELPVRRAAFVAAAHLAYFRPGLYARYLVATRIGLKAWLLAAIKLVAPRLPIAPDLEGPTQEAYAVLSRMMVGPARDRLAEPVSELLRNGATVDLARWMAAVDLTADRAGLLLADDLGTALELVKSSKDEATSVPVAERLRELLRYAVSDAYLSLRAHLGVDVGRKKLSLFEV